MSDRRGWRGNRQTVSWFIDLYRRELLDLDPPYQRRSVWNQRYREDFIETVLLGYPAPSLFLYEDISEDGSTRYAVVDGKQRLTAIFDFADDRFPTRDEPSVKLPTALRGKYLSDLEADTKRPFWGYEFTVEYLPSTDEALLNEVFDRINRNVAKLTRQELRHARYNGVFASAVEGLEGEMRELLGVTFPRIVESSRRQMKDVEFVANLALLVDRGPEAISQDELDQIYSDRDDDWEGQSTVAERFRSALRYIAELLQAEPDIASTRLRNQGDFYALVGAIDGLGETSELPEAAEAAPRLLDFATTVGDSTEMPSNEDARRYYEAARSAANDAKQRQTRIEILRKVIAGSN